MAGVEKTKILKRLKYFDLSIVIPALNEEKRIGKSLENLSKYIKQDSELQKLDIEVIVVAAGNRDKTRDIVRQNAKYFQKLILLTPEGIVGKGRDVQLGVHKATGEYVLFMDADLATPIYHIAEFLKLCQKGNNIVIGERVLKTHIRNPLRSGVSIMGNMLFRLVSGLSIEDSQCGFKMFSSRAAKKCFSKQTVMGWGFDMEILTIARINRLYIKTVRLNDWEDKPFSTYKRNFVINSLKSLFDLGVILKNRVMGNY